MNLKPVLSRGFLHFILKFDFIAYLCYTIDKSQGGKLNWKKSN